MLASLVLGLSLAFASPAAPSERDPTVTAESSPAIAVDPSPSTVPALSPATTPSPATTQSPADRKREQRGRRSLILGGASFGVGSGLQWLALGLGGRLSSGPAPRGGLGVGPSMSMAFGGMAMFEGVLVVGLGANELGRRAPKDRRRARSFRAAGWTLVGAGGAGLLTAGMLFPQMRARCPHGDACAVASLQLGAAALTAGTGLAAYGHANRPYEDRRERFPRKARGPWIAGWTMLGVGYFNSFLIGTVMWQQRDDARGRRIRNGLYVPVVGPFIVAAGPDVRFFPAAAFGGLGLMQVGGLVAATVGGGITIHDRRKRRRADFTVVPTSNGAALVGHF